MEKWVENYFAVFSLRAFNTLVDIKLKHWADTSLPRKCIDVAWETLREQFQKIMQQDAQARDHDTIFDPVKSSVAEHAMNLHVWEPKAADYLVYFWFRPDFSRQQSKILSENFVLRSRK